MSTLDFNVLPVVAPEEGPGAVKSDPDIRVTSSDDTYGKVAVEPLERGFGLTIGNPLRRILLSSTPGSAITWVKIDDVVHEYAAIPGVKEEVMEILLNIKRVRIRSSSNRTGKMRLDVVGEGPVCAGDIATSSDFEIVNPELHLATLDTGNTNLAIEFNVDQGVGYQAVGQNDGAANLPAGALPVDAVFSPVSKVNYQVEQTRVGQKTDYERLVLEVWTDGTIRPVEAVQKAAGNLGKLLFLFNNLDRAAEAGVDRPPLVVSPEVYQTPIEKLELSPRTLNCLKRAHVSRVGEVLEMSDDDLLKIRNFGEKSLVELQEKLTEHGIVGSNLARSSILGALPPSSLSPDDLGELIGGGQLETSVPSGMSPVGDFDDDESGNDESGNEDDPEADDDFDDDEESC